MDASVGFGDLSCVRRLLVVLVGLATGWTGAVDLRADSTVVFNELMYHPESREADLEWLELHNQLAVDVDLSAWSLSDGVLFTFPDGTIIPGGGYLVVARAPAALEASVGIAGVLGPYEGALRNSGERLELRNNSYRLMDALSYGDEDGWPVAPDGSGLSLAKIDPDTASASPANWTRSAQMGGTPGVLNFTVSGEGGEFPPGLVSYWSFDGTGSTVRDLADGNHGSSGGSAVRVPGLAGSGAFELDNTVDAFIEVGPGTSDNFSTSTGIAIEALIRPEWSGSAGDYDVIFRKEDGTNRVLLSFQNDSDAANRDVQIVPEAQPVLAFGLKIGGVYSELDTPLDGQEGRPSLSGLTDGGTHHIAATYDSSSGSKRLYVDGVLVFEASFPPGALITSGGGSTAYIGNMAGRGRPFTGLLDEVAFWSRALDETEVAAHATAAGGGQGYFSATGVGPLLAINEMLLSEDDESWIELLNHGESAAELGGLILRSAGVLPGEYVFPAGGLEPGHYLTLTESDLGFDLVVGNKLFLFTPERSDVLAAEEAKQGLRGLLPGGDGRLLWPDSPTPGGPNSFTLHDEIVINEIMYHPRPLSGVPPTVEEVGLVAVDASWRYDDSGNGHSTPAWREPGFDDSSWDVGPALLFVEEDALPGPKNTPLALGATTYYFRGTFEMSGDPLDATLFLRLVVDDGAIVYLNGEELLRLNMDPGPVTPDTFAGTGVGNATPSEDYRLPAERVVSGTNTLAVEVHQAAADSSDVVFGLEVFGTVITEPGRAFGEPPESYIELYNRSETTVDLGGWRLAGGVDYLFAAETLLGPDEYLVVAEDRDALAALFPGARIIGNLQRRLSNREDRILLDDASRNPVDDVHYFDGDRWPAFADGGGASLELRDPWADNSRAESWAASDESLRSGWKTYSYEQVASANIGPTLWPEFVLGLLDDGEILMDDLSVIESPGAGDREFISNGTFEPGPSPWRILGNHRHSQVVPDPDDPGNRVLHVVATGATEHMHNHAEITLANGESTVNGRTYRVSFRARWIAGSNQLNTRLYFNRVPRTTLLEVPRRHGTPGSPNSRLEPNTGPTFAELRHRPVVPGVDEPVVVSVLADDPDGLAIVELWYAVEDGAWVRVTMERAGNGRFTAGIPGQESARTVQFYIEAEDSAGAVATFPAAGRASRALYRVEDGQADFANKHNFRIILTPDDTTFLHEPIQVMSNDRVPCTVVYDERDVYYDVGVRLKGSERGRDRPERTGYNVRFDRERLFRGVHRTVAIDRSGDLVFGTSYGQSEILVKHMIQRAGGMPGMYDDLVHFIAPRRAQTGTALLQMARYSDVFLESQYPDGGEGTVFEMELIYYPRTTDGDGFKLPEPDSVLGVDIADHGDDKEIYRWNFLITNSRDRDDYEGLVRLNKTFSLSGGGLELEADGLMDVSEWMRVFAMQTLCGVTDSYSRGNNHNLRIYVPPGDGGILAMPWDWDFAFMLGTTTSLFGDQNITNFYERPRYRHLYYGHLLDILRTSFNTTYMSRWTSHYGTLAGRSYSSLLDYIGSRGDFVLANLPGEVPFAITTNGGGELTVDTTTVVLEGVGWIDVRRLRLAGGPIVLEPDWIAVTGWRVEVPLAPGVNDIALIALDANDDMVGQDEIRVTTTAEFPTTFIRGDSNMSGIVEIGDAVTTAFHVLRGVPLGCLEAADSDGNGTVAPADIVFLLRYLFLHGSSPPDPFPLAGPDTNSATGPGCENGL